MKNNIVVWFEIYVQDMARAQKFYESVLVTKLENMDSPGMDSPGMEMLSFPGNDGYGATGTLVKMEGFPSGGNSTLVYFGCEDCAVEAGRVADAGGRIQKEKTSLGENGFMALAFDTEGNMFGLHSIQ